MIDTNNCFCFLRILQENIKSREIQWAREREDLQKNIKSQEMMIQKLTADRMQLETRWIFALALRVIHDLIVPDLFFD